MKINHLLGVICLLLLPSHSFATSQIKKIDQSLKPFTQITLNGNFNLEFIQGTDERVIMEGKEQVLDEIEIIQSGGKLTIGKRDEDQWKGMKKVYVRLYFRELNRMVLNGISQIKCETPIASPELTIECNGIRGIDMHLEVGHLVAVFNGVGNTYLYGTADKADIDYTGIGNLEAFDLKTEQMKIESTGIGRVEVCALSELDVVASGIGSVRYIGNPNIKHFNGSGIGKIKAARF